MRVDPIADILNADLLASGETTVPRFLATNNAPTTLSNQSMRLAYFTAAKTENITQVRIPSGGTAAGATPTICRFGIYQIDPVTLLATLVASIANDTTLWAASNTDYLRTLSAAWKKIANVRYVAAWLCVTGAAAPSIPGMTIMSAGTPGSNAAGRTPRLGGTLASQTDLPGSFADASVTSNPGMGYAELMP